MATYYKDFLGLDYPDWASYSVERGLILFTKSTGECATADGQEYGYNKPKEYLTVALVEGRKTRNDFERAISVLKDLHTVELVSR
ncbi:MAG: hypothetical protein M1839_006830 [Geoglossum umbratile]|nr:MAG: hypothetical protein M1839_006830 [Geoglossum umbratile]